MTNKIFAARAENEFRRTQALFQSDSGNPTNSWQLGRACFDFADFSTNKTQRADIARLGIAACQQLIAREPESVPAHYYLAMDYGQLAEAEEPSIAAYKLIKEIEREFKIAARLDAEFDFAGPARNLGLLYRDAPGWPVSIGSKRKAREFLEQAAALAPDYPENQLNLAESQLKWRQRDDAEKTLAKLDAIWPSAQTKLTGEFWEQSWSDWKSRRTAARAEFQFLFKRVP
ncbi:MAG TPA: tetratricopeptide repeat protein [Verrucomicrobiae bacterium]